ncbi:MAG: hypothetical protein ABR520_08140 [Mycobacteriales bacterium]
MAVVAALGVASGAIADVSAVSACRDYGRVSVRSDGWSRVNSPPTPRGRGVMTTYATLPGKPHVLLAASGAVIYRSGDRGCTWTTAYDGDLRSKLTGQSALDSLETRRVTLFGVSPISPSRIYAVVVEKTVDAVVTDARSFVVTSVDLGLSWVPANGGLPFPGEATAIDVADDPQLCVLAVQQPLRSLDMSLQTTRDGGASWQGQRPAMPGGPLVDFALDPLTPTNVWAWNATGLAHSIDGGASFTAVDFTSARVPPGAVSAAIVVHALPGPTTIVAFRGADNLELRSTDGGKTWRAAFAPAGVDGVAAGPVAATGLAVTSGGHAYLELSSAPAVEVTPSGATGLHEPRLVFDEGRPLVYFNAGTALFRRRFTIPRIVRLPPVARLPNTHPVAARPPRILPRDGVIRLAPGEATSVDYVLDLPAIPTPLDVFFLVDTTGSMSPTIAGLREGIGKIVTDLARLRLDVQFGLGDFKDYPVEPYGDPSDYPYKRRLPITEPGEPLREAIGTLEPSGGGDGPESDLTAVYQSVTGKGQRVVPGVDAGAADFVAPGQDAGFRPTALKVVILATDVQFHTEPTYPGPTFDDTLTELTSRGVRVVGLAVGADPRGEDEIGGPRPDLVRLAGGSGALAPASGVDCNGDGRQDVAPAAPMVCPLRGTGSRVELADAIVSLVRAIRDHADVTVRADGDPNVVLGSAPAVFPHLDVKAHNVRSFRVGYTCPQSYAGHTTTATLRATVRGEDVASATAHVVCGPRRAAIAGPAAAPPAAALTRPVAAAVAPPPPPAPLPQANSQANAQLNAQPQPQPNVGLAAQPQPQPQAAVAKAEVGREELAFSERHDDTATGGALAIAATCLCAMVAWVARPRIQLARARSTPRR